MDILHVGASEDSKKPYHGYSGQNYSISWLNTSLFFLVIEVSIK